MLPNTDLAALRLFVNLFRTGNLSAAAELSNVTPGAASRTISKLRDLFGDELFVRHAFGMAPTPRAKEIYPDLVSLLRSFGDLLKPAVFTPSAQSRVFHIACVDNAVMIFLRPIVKPLLDSSAGHASLDFRILQKNFWHQLKIGDLDFAVYPVEGTRENFHIQPLCSDCFVYVTDRSHPLAELAKKRPLTESDIAKFRQVKVLVTDHSDSPDGLSDYEDSVLPSASSTVAIWSSYFVVTPSLIEGTDLVAIMPLQLASRLSKWLSITVLGRPEKGSIHHPSLIWHDSKHADPACQWLRSLILTATNDLAEPADIPLIRGR